MIKRSGKFNSSGRWFNPPAQLIITPPAVISGDSVISIKVISPPMELPINTAGFAIFSRQKSCICRSQRLRL